MKESYETPTAEKLEFNYAEVVTASAQGCRNGTSFTHNGANCISNVLTWAVNNQG